MGGGRSVGAADLLVVADAVIADEVGTADAGGDAADPGALYPAEIDGDAPAAVVVLDCAEFDGGAVPGRAVMTGAVVVVLAAAYGWSDAVSVAVVDVEGEVVAAGAVMTRVCGCIWLLLGWVVLLRVVESGAKELLLWDGDVLGTAVNPLDLPDAGETVSPVVGRCCASGLPIHYHEQVLIVQVKLLVVLSLSWTWGPQCDTNLVGAA